jgi:hypothetical protein
MNEIVTLLLSWRMAQQYKKDESKAVYLCSNKIWKNVTDANIRNMIIQLGKKTTSSFKRMEVIHNLEYSLRLNKLL